MTVWDELRPILTRLRDDHRETLLEFPDPRLGEGQPPPYQITLAPTAVAVAEDLHRRFGDNVQLTVGRLPYPPGRQPDRPLDHLIRQSPGEGADVAGERKSRWERGRGWAAQIPPAPGLGSALSELRRLNAELLAAAGQLKPVTIEALLRGGPGTGFGLEQGA